MQKRSKVVSRTRVCNMCHKRKRTEQFSARTAARAGHQYTCKSCNKKYHVKWLKQNQDHCNDYLRQYRKEHPGRYRCHKRVEAAVRRGDIVLGKCTRCGSKRVFAHHDDYRRWAAIKPECPSCHNSRLAVA